MLGLLAAFLAVYFTVSLVIIPRVRDHHHREELIQAKEKTLSGYLGILENEKALNKKISNLENSTKRYDRYFLESDKPALAAAEVQNRIKEVADIYGLEVTSEKIATSIKSGNYVIIPVQITATGDVGHLKDFLYEIESSIPLMTASQLTVRVSKKRKFDPETRKYHDVEELQATVLINGLMKG